MRLQATSKSKVRARINEATARIDEIISLAFDNEIELDGTSSIFG